MKARSLILFIIVLACQHANAQVEITIDTTITFQKIEGWGHGGGVFSNLNYMLAQTEGQQVADSLNYQYLDYIVHDLGLTGSRMWEVGPRIDGTGIDFAGNCDSLDWTKFWVPSIDTQVVKYATYFKQLVEAEGHKTSFYSSPTYPTFATMFKPWVMSHPGERALQIWADALWWKQFGIDINYAVIQNEPQFGSSWNTQVLSDDIDALGPRLDSHGLTTKVQWAEGVDPHTSWMYDTSVHRDPQWWSYVGRLSYHRYGTDDPYRGYLADSAGEHMISTGQTEMANPTVEDIFSDLVQGNCTYWEVGFSGPNTMKNTPGGTNWTPSSTYFRLRQVMHYVQPGDVRIGAAANDSMVQVLAFKGKNGITTIVINHRAQQTVTISGLRPGKYGLSQSPNGASAFQENGIKTVGTDGTISFTIGGSGQTATLYPYVGPNHAPTIQTWTINPGYVVAPTTSASLTATASDAEGDPMTYQWSVLRQPVGANATFTSPTALTTTVNGLTLPGLYIFTISVSDGTNVSNRKLYLEVYSTNPPPWLWQSGFRFSAPYGLVFANPEDTTHANVELPTSSATLQVGISDLANSDFSGRGKWTLVSQPPGANATFDDTTKYYFISIRRPVSNMSVPGDYVFQCNVTNPGHPDLIDRIICTVHPASSGPVINSITAAQDTVTLPQSSSKLSASTSDPQGQLLRHWWAIKSVPTGAKPSFDHQGLPNSTVSGLSVPGTYIFTLRAFDDLHMTTKDFRIVVNPGTGKGVLAVTPDTLDFGSIDTGKISKLTATLHNIGNGPITISAVNITVSFADSLSKPVPLTLQSGDSLTVSIIFTPRTIGVHTGSFRVTLSDDSIGSIFLEGIGKAIVQGGVAPARSQVEDIIIFPNPTTDDVMLYSTNDEEKISHITVVNLLGQVMIDKEIAGSESANVVLSLRELPEGIYPIAILSNGTAIRKIIIKQRP
ncbi:MAG TPA: T9SS type A sorting domain-containing protein [Candidatus Kapabacteria bacterium]|nr:T9SS type A sorting domain-containing protein [Candidatus Kapabacteria bacterium]